MQQIKRTIGFYFSHSYVTLFSIILLSAVLMPMQIILPGNTGEPDKIITFMVFTSGLIGSFVGIYFAGGMLKLKQHYLWAINPHYRNVLITAFLLLVIICSAVQAAVLSVNLSRLPLILTLPFCAAMFSAFTVLGKTMVHKFLIPIAPIALGFTTKLGVPPNVILLLVFGAAVFLIYYLFEVDKDRVKTAKETLQEVGMGETSGLPLTVTKINHAIGRHLSPMIAKSKRDISWAVSLPYFKLALVPMVYLIFIIPMSLFAGDEKSVVELFTAVMTASTIISLIGESHRLLPQIKSVAHTFAGNNHQVLKTQIIKATDFLIVKNCLVLNVSVVLICELLAISYHFKLISIQSILVIGVGLAFTPGFLSLKWINVSFALVAALAAYFGVIILSAVWLGDTPESEWLSLPAVSYIAALIGLRKLGKAYFLSLPMESLFKVK